MGRTFTPENIANMRNHADFIERLPKDDSFDMNDFCSYDKGDLDLNSYECGTAMCAIGWAARNPDLPTPSSKHVFWESYSFSLFGTDNHDQGFGFDCFHSGLPGNPKIISGLMREVADRMEKHMEAQS